MSNPILKAFIIALAFGCCFYFMEYVVRSSPAVMIGNLAARLQATPLVVSGILGAYYYTYSVTSLIAGVALDRVGAKYPVSIGIGILALGCLLFALPSWLPEETGRLCQGAGSAFAFTGCVYLASHGFSARTMATAIGMTQCIGMLGGSAGQFVVGPMIHHGVSVWSFWIACAIICAGIGLGLLEIIPRETEELHPGSALSSIITPYKTVFSNPQSWLSGLISGLLFAPTTIFAMTWGVAFFQQDLKFPYEKAVLFSSLVPLGWVIGCPLLGWISDRTGLRRAHALGRDRIDARELRHPHTGIRHHSPRRSGADLRHSLRRGNDPLYDHQGSQPGTSKRKRHRRDQSSSPSASPRCWDPGLRAGMAKP